MTDYIALLRKDDDSDYGVNFPDFPGCVTAGADLDEAKDMASEALSAHIEAMKENGMGLPGPSALDTIMADQANIDAVVFLVSAPEASEKAVRINVTIPESVLHRIDAAVLDRGTNRSAFLKEAAVKELEVA